MSAELVAVVAYHDKLNEELTTQRTEMEMSRSTLAVKMDFIELLKRCKTSKKAKYVREPKENT